MVVVVVATLQRALHVCMGQKKTGMLITFSDLYQKCLRKPWKFLLFFFQAEDGIRSCLLSRGLGDVYKRQ